MKTVVFAYHNIGIVGLEALKRHGFDIRAIFSHRDDPKENVWFGSVVQWAQQHQIAVFCPENVNESQWVAKIAGMNPEMIFSFYYRFLLDEKILSIPPLGAFNLHGSLLPAYRGRIRGSDAFGPTRPPIQTRHFLRDHPGVRRWP